MKEVYKILNGISLAAGVIAILMVMTLDWLRPNLMKRVNLQLQTGIAFLDTTRHILYYCIAVPENNILCSLTAFYIYFADQLYVLLNVAIALNLHLLLLKQIQPKPFLRWIYLIASVGISLLINLIPLGLKYFGKSPRGVCLLVNNIPNLVLLKILLIHLINWPGMIYCLVVSILVIYRYYYKNYQYKIKTIYSEPEVRWLSWTVALYPLTCFITIVGYSTFNLALDGFNRHFSKTLHVCANLGLRSTGLLNLLCLLIDSQVWCAIQSLRKPNNENSKVLELDIKSSNENFRQEERITENEILSPSNPYDSYIEQRENLIRFL